MDKVFIPILNGDKVFIQIANNGQSVHTES